MTIYIYDPHIIPMGENLLSILFKKRAVKTLSYILETIQEKDDVEILTDFLSTYAPIRTWSKFPLCLRKFIAFIDIHIWCIANKVPFNKLNYNSNKLEPLNDTIFAYGTINSIFENQQLTKMSSLARYTGRTFIHIYHYFTYPETIAASYKLIANPMLVAEANLTQNSFYQQFLGEFGTNFILPFASQPRFKNSISFSKRKNKALALGTYLCLQETDLGHKNIIKHFNSTALHPMRKIIYENRESIQNQIDSIISKQPFEDDEKKNQKAEKLKGIGLYIFKLFTKEQEKYLSLDIVDKYNEYKMVISPEESIGLPSINLVEAMSCGSAYIGVDSEIYSGLGLKKNEHYISYDGTLDDLLIKIQYYQKNPQELEEIANNGYKFAREYFSSKFIKNRFYQNIKAVNF